MPMKDNPCKFPHDECGLCKIYDQIVIREYCIERHNVIKEDISVNEKRISKIEDRNWSIAIGIIAMLLVGVGNLILQIADKPDTTEIAKQVANILKSAH